jgi:hypothetical protein
MSKQFTSLLATFALLAVVAAAPQAQARLPQHSAGAAALYPIPPAHTPAVAVHASALAAAHYLATLSPSALAATGGLELNAGASGPGTFTFVLTARLHGRTIVIGKGSKAAGHAGALTIKLTLTKAGKSALAGANGKLVVTVAATFKPKHGKAKTSRSTATLH